MSDSDDEDLKRAIALSLTESNPETQPAKTVQAVIDLISDVEDDDDDLDAPVIARKLSTAIENSSTAAKTSQALQEVRREFTVSFEDGTRSRTRLTTESDSLRLKPSPNQGNTEKQNATPNSLLGGLDRKKMEQERLARSAAKRTKHQEKERSMALEPTKRKFPSSPQPGNSKRQALDPLAGFPASLSGRALSVYETKPANLKKLPTSNSTNAGTAKEQVPAVSFYNNRQNTLSGIQYLNGVVKKTWVRGCPRQGDDIKIEEVLQKEDLDFAVLSAYQVDPDWVISKLEPKTKVVMVLQAKTEQEKQIMLSSSDKNFRFCFPSMEGQINCMHSKLQLLAHPTHLRIAVPSANLVPYDWGETGVMENICFLIDLPRLPADHKVELVELTHFATELLYFLKAMGLDQNLIDSLRKFDFSHTSKFGFIHTIGGSHSSGNAWKRTGYCGLGTSVKKLGLETEEALDIDFVTASIGNITEDFIKCMVLAAKGDDGTREFGWRNNKPSSKYGVKASTEAERTLSDEVQSGCRIYFPTRETVAASKGGVVSGGAICFQSKWFDSSSFPRTLLCDSKSVREGILMHDKITYVRPKSLSGTAWAYVGSANLSESAWGRLVKDRASKELKLNCRNWECGILFPVPPTLRSYTPTQGSSNHRKMGMDVFEGHVPVPMLAGQEYGGRRPWFYLEE